MLEAYLQEAPVAGVIFIITIVYSLIAFFNQDVYAGSMMHPYSVSRGEKVYTLLTSGFVHNGFAHLLFNMFSYFFFAFPLEMRLGHWQFGLLYIVSIILSDIPTVVKHKDDFWYRSLGASGGVCAVLFSYILFSPFTRLMIFPLPIPIPAILYAVLFLAYCVYASRQQADNINHDAHFFGALNGLVLTILLKPGIVPYFFSQLGLG
ncbi:MAG: rhomboid family intramembrane serine protease [Mucilaginibacter polytrichastri]|nr:rhomboid family intramembrane serine protease [Mucilaginibacter polytrichastri]